MSEEQHKSFLEKVKADTSLQEELKGAADVDAVIDIAKEAGFTVSGDEIKAAQPQVELSDEDLKGVAGGLPDIQGWGGPACVPPHPSLFKPINLNL